MPTDPQQPMTPGAAWALIVSSLVGIGGFIKAYRDSRKKESDTVSLSSYRRLAKRVTVIESWIKSFESKQGK